ncbi:glycosyltransferase family 25 protein [Aeromonas caviae]|uniref:glycosyltransferase family 25 protein n=1 Tax=Aeromonas caviae TaxID=648 RepID=UPI0038CFB0A6
MTVNNVKVFVLSLPHAHERRKSVQRQFTELGIDFEFFNGVYGNNLSESEIGLVYDSERAKIAVGRDLTKGEIGATYSHFKMYQKALNEGCEYLIIFEDDIIIDKRLKTFVDNLVTSTEVEDKSSIYFIQEHCNVENMISNDSRRTLAGFDFKRMFSSEEYFVGAYGYVLNNLAMKKLVQGYLKFYFVCDHWYFVRKIARISRFYFLEQALVFTNTDDVREVDSFIQSERKKVIKTARLGIYQMIKLRIKKFLFSIFSIDRYEKDS